MLITMTTGIHASDPIMLAPSFSDRLAIYKVYDGNTVVYQFFVKSTPKSMIERITSRYQNWDNPTRFEFITHDPNNTVIKEFEPFKETLLK